MLHPADIRSTDRQRKKNHSSQTGRQQPHLRTFQRARAGTIPSTKQIPTIHILQGRSQKRHHHRARQADERLHHPGRGARTETALLHPR